MSFRIHKDERLDKGLARIAAEELRYAAVQLEKRADPERIHNLRRSLKKIRAVLLLFHKRLPKKFCRAENKRFRDCAKLFSPLRDAQVRRQVLRKLKVAECNVVGPNIRKALAQHEREFVSGNSGAFSKTAVLLRHTQAQVARWPLHQLDFADFGHGLKDLFKNARKAFKRAAKDCIPENLHQWRKQMKALRHALELATTFSDKKTHHLTGQINCLGDLLGEDHDLVLLSETLRETTFRHPKKDYRALCKAIVKKRSRLRKRVITMGRKVFKTKPAAFSRHMAHCLNN